MKSSLCVGGLLKAVLLCGSEKHLFSFSAMEYIRDRQIELCVLVHIFLCCHIFCVPCNLSCMVCKPM